MSWLNYLMEIFSDREALAPRPTLKTCSHCGSKVEYLQPHPGHRNSFYVPMVCRNCACHIYHRKAMLENQKKPTEFLVEEEL